MSAGGETGAPGRLAVPTCIGCGAMRLPGACETGCSERRRDLVRADACDWVDGLAERAHRRADALRPLVGVIAGMPDDGPVGVGPAGGRPAGGRAEKRGPVDDAPGGNAEAAFRALQAQARRQLRLHPDTDAANAALGEPPDEATTWWCDSCGGLDAPQDCLGICIWRPIDWVDTAVYERSRRRAEAEREQERRLRAVLRQAAYVHPRAGGYEATRRALRAEAGRALAAGAEPLRRPARESRLRARS